MAAAAAAPLHSGSGKTTQPQTTVKWWGEKKKRNQVLNSENNRPKAQNINKAHNFVQPVIIITTTPAAL